MTSTTPYIIAIALVYILVAVSYYVLAKRISAISVPAAAAATTTDYTVTPTVTNGTLKSGSASVTPLSNKITMLTYDVQLQPNTGATTMSCVIQQPNSQVYTNLRNVIIEGSSSNGNVDIYNLAYQSDLANKKLTVTFTINDTSIHKVDVILFVN